MEYKWQISIDNLSKRRENIVAAGGLDRIAKQHSSGKLTARERMDALFDDGTFVEINDMITSRATDFGMNKKKHPAYGMTKCRISMKVYCK